MKRRHQYPTSERVAPRPGDEDETHLSQVRSRQDPPHSTAHPQNPEQLGANSMIGGSNPSTKTPGPPGKQSRPRLLVPQGSTHRRQPTSADAQCGLPASIASARSTRSINRKLTCCLLAWSPRKGCPFFVQATSTPTEPRGNQGTASTLTSTRQGTHLRTDTAEQSTDVSSEIPHI